MADFLEQLVQDAERTVSSGYYDVPLASSRGPRLSSVLQRGSNFPIIAEVKIASPSRGRLSSHAPGELIDGYVSGGAAALSVLTEPVRFLGSLETLRTAAGTGLPVLMKDFIVSEEQMDAAAAVGALTMSAYSGLSPRWISDPFDRTASRASWLSRNRVAWARSKSDSMKVGASIPGARTKPNCSSCRASGEVNMMRAIIKAYVKAALDWGRWLFQSLE
jgi:hypothetical protein